jgi:hypothetical protein
VAEHERSDRRINGMKMHSRKSVRSVELEDASSLAAGARVASSARSRISCLVVIPESGEEARAGDLTNAVSVLLCGSLAGRNPPV